MLAIGWGLWGVPTWPSSSTNGLPHSMAVKLQKHGSTCAPCHFPCILLVKASPESSPDSTGGETEFTSWCRRSLYIQGGEKLLVACIKDNLPTLSSYDSVFISTLFTSLQCAWQLVRYLIHLETNLTTWYRLSLSLSWVNLHSPC